MALQTTGAISLADIQTEFGGSNPISIDEYYAGAATGYVASGTSGTNGAIPSSGQISFSSFYGTTKADVQTVLVGSSATEGFFATGYDNGGLGIGAYGSISDGTFNALSGATIASITWYTTGVGGAIYFAVNGAYDNSGWTNMKIGTTDYARSTGSFSNSTSGVTYWTWTEPTNRFSSDGTNTVVTFT